MRSLPESIASLIQILGKLPGIGPRSAERLALHIVQADPALAESLASTIQQTRQTIKACKQCGALTDVDPCSVCSDHRRDAGIICVVEQATDILSIEKTGVFNGRYHALGGRISPINGVEPEDLRIAELEQRLQAESITEIVLALGSDVEGDATSNYLAERLSSNGITVTQLAQGLPAGSGLEYADELTLSRALQGRKVMRT